MTNQREMSIILYTTRVGQLEETENECKMKKQGLRKCILLLCLILLTGCQAGGKNADRDTTGVESGDTGDIGADGEKEEGEGFEAEYIHMKKKEKETIKEQMLSIGNLCRTIYAEADKGDASNVVLEESVVHAMAEETAGRGWAVTCGSYDYNMLNYEQVHKELLSAAEGRSAEAEFFQITTSGYFMYFKLLAEKGNLTVTYANASYDEGMEIQVRQMEKFKVYDWEYTEKGWLIWEKAPSRNQEMDMHSFFRILPLDEKCREICSQYISPVSYFCNNLFLTDWDAGSMDQIEFNDLYDFLYRMKYGEMLDEETARGGIEKEQFENVVQAYFDISAEELERYARYDSVKGVYPWEPIGAWNRVRQVQPFPEVVKCVDNGDGTRTVYVEGITIVKGDDCTYRHTVTMKEKDGRWVYTGNDIDEEGSESIPGYKPRREYESLEKIQ